jgi:hypothetical protein
VFKTDTGLTLSVSGDLTVKIGVAIGRCQGSFTLSPSVASGFFDWITSLSPLEYAGDRMAQFQGSGWTATITTALDCDGKTRKIPAEIIVHIGTRNPSFWVFKLADMKKAIKWYNSEIKDEVTA